MASSGQYKKGSVPDEIAFMPVTVRPEQSASQIVSELMKLQQ
jgi:hypothetical protein